MSDAVREVIVGATTTLAVFGAFLAFGICLIAAVSKFVEERNRPNNIKAATRRNG